VMVREGCNAVLGGDCLVNLEHQFELCKEKVAVLAESYAR